MAVLVWLPLAAEWPAAETLDLDAIYRIKDEGLQRSKVMELESYLTDVYGPRLTGSPNIKEAGDWAQKTMKSWGLANVHLTHVWPASVHDRLAVNNIQFDPNPDFPSDAPYIYSYDDLIITPPGIQGQNMDPTREKRFRYHRIVHRGAGTEY